jgi:hypothetical protein
VRGSSEFVASGRHLHFAAFPFGSPLLVHLMSERARILLFNSLAFVGRAPLMAVPQTGDRLLFVLAHVGASLKIGFPSLNNSRHRHFCVGPSRVHLRACGRPLFASARSAPASPHATACRSCASPSPSACALLRRTCVAPSVRLGHSARYCSLQLLASVQVPHLPRSLPASALTSRSRASLQRCQLRIGPLCARVPCARAPAPASRLLCRHRARLLPHPRAPPGSAAL